MFQQVAIALGSGLQFVEELGEEGHVELVDLRHALDLGGVIAVMRKRMMRIRDTDLGVGPVAGLAGELEGDDTRDVALKGQHLEVEHQPGMVGIGGRHADGAVEIRQRILLCSSLGLLNATLDLTDGVEVLRQPGAVAGTEFALELVEVAGEGIQQAGAALEGGAAFGPAAALAEEVLEHDTRVGLGG